jgi:hypothetical protein
MSTPVGAYNHRTRPRRAPRCCCATPLAVIEGREAECVKCGHSIGSVVRRCEREPTRSLAR